MANPGGAIAPAGGADYAAIANALRRQPQNVKYHDYKPKEDFSLWLAGYREKVRNAFGFAVDQNAELEQEVVRSISGKLTSGPALDAYDRLLAPTKLNYELLKAALLNEFVDPQEKTRFQEDFGFNKRKKDQSLKEFMQEIIKDQGRYSDMRDTIGLGVAAGPNQEKIRDGIRRFKKGIRNKEGKKDSNQIRHLRYNLLTNADLNWETALDIASRWEAANDVDDNPSSSSSSSEEEDSLDAVECVKGKKEAKSSRKSKKVVINALEGDDARGAVAALTVEVKKNARDIKGVKSEQERLTANVTSWINETTYTMGQILTVVKGIQAGQDQPNKNL